MRYVVGFVLALALVASPLSVSAKIGDDGAAPEPNVEEPTPSSEPAPEEPALQLELDSAGVDVVSSPPRTADGYLVVSDEEMKLRERTESAVARHRGGLIASSVVLALGIGLGAAGASIEDPECGDGDPGCISSSAVALGSVGIALTLGGLVGMAVKGAKLARSKRELRMLQQAHYGARRRVHWELARSRLVF
jgi:hypothetical protein